MARGSMPRTVAPLRCADHLRHAAPLREAAPLRDIAPLRGPGRDPGPPAASADGSGPRIASGAALAHDESAAQVPSC